MVVFSITPPSCALVVLIAGSSPVTVTTWFVSPGLQREVHANVSTDIHRNILALDRIETLGLDANRVLSGDIRFGAV